jgi:hypothetical protein
MEGYFMTVIHEDPKLDVIAHALVHKGIVLWQGIPEHIVSELKAHGYKVKKKKKFKNL